MKRIALLVALACAGFAAVTALAGNDHRCKHHCGSTDSSPPNTATVTVTTTEAAAPAQTVTATLPAMTQTQTQSQTQTVVVVTQNGKVVTRTVTKIKIRKVRRYCTMQRHGWRCGPNPPRGQHR